MTTLDEIQDMLQDTTGEESGLDFHAQPIKPSEPTALCSNVKGCGKMYPRDERGSDFRFAMMCAACFAKESRGHDQSTAHSRDIPVSSLLPDEQSSLTCLPIGDTVADKVDSSLATITLDAVPANSDEPQQGHQPADLDNDGDNGDEDSSVESPSGNEEVAEAGGVESALRPGYLIGIILSNVRDSGVNIYEVECGKNINKYKLFINDQDNITGKSKKFFSLVPDPTETLFAYSHYHALLNTRSNCGWLGHCRLSTSKLGAEGHGYVLWEIWETLCDRPRIDGIVIREDGEVFRLTNIENWLNKHELNSDLETPFDEDFYTK
jgi:hypothetical protein